jgi:Fe-S cluster biogenesis protein NfuA
VLSVCTHVFPFLIPRSQTVLDNPDGNGLFLNKSDPIEEILKSPLAKELFKVDGVKSVYFGADFVTITKFAESKWNFMRPEIFSILMDFFEKPDRKVLLDQPIITDTTILDDDDEIVAMIKELIEDRIRPAVQEDGGDIRYVDFDEHTGMVTVKLLGSCVGCPSSSITLKQGVENMLMHYIPEVTAVVALDEEEERDSVDGIEGSNDVKTQKTYEERLKAAGIPFSD